MTNANYLNVNKCPVHLYGWRKILTATAVIIAIGIANISLAKKPVDPPTEPPPQIDGGLVYGDAYNENGVLTLFALDLDTDTLVPLCPSPDLNDYNFYALGPLNPSDADHGGRWFVYTDAAPEDGEYPGNNSLRLYPVPCVSIYALHESGTVVKLTSRLLPDNLILEPVWGWYPIAPVWLNGDSEIWFMARKLHADGEPVADSWGIYSVPVSFVNGTIAAGTPTMVPQTNVFDGNYYYTDSGGFGWLTFFDVSDDGTTLFYTRTNIYAGTSDLYKKDLSSGNESFLFGGDFVVTDPFTYHEGQNAITGSVNYGLFVRIDAATGTHTVLARSDRKTNLGGLPYWSPSGDQIVIAAWAMVRGDRRSWHRIIDAADGKVLVEIEPPGGAIHACGWRAAPGN